MADRANRRFPNWVFANGAEPDPRFTLANERTFLAWMRTALALLAGGVALEALGLSVDPVLRLAASLALLVMGLAFPLFAWWHWTKVERAMRTDAHLPSPGLGLPLAIGIGIVGVLLLIGVAIGPAS